MRIQNKKVNFEHNIAEYMFCFNTDKQTKLKKKKNSIQTVNTENYKNNYWEFTKKKIIWARKSDRIKNDIDYDIENLAQMKKSMKKMSKEVIEKEQKITMFDKINKFKKYDSLGERNE